MVRAVRPVAGLNDVAVMGEPVQKSLRQLGIVEDRGPLRNRQVGGNQSSSVLVELSVGELVAPFHASDLANHVHCDHLSRPAEKFSRAVEHRCQFLDRHQTVLTVSFRSATTL